MVWFWGSSGDAGSVWFYPRETSNPPYASRVNTTSPESYHTSPEEENPSGEVKYLELVLVGKDYPPVTIEFGIEYLAVSQTVLLQGDPTVQTAHCAMS